MCRSFDGDVFVFLVPRRNQSHSFRRQSTVPPFSRPSRCTLQRPLLDPMSQCDRDRPPTIPMKGRWGAVAQSKVLPVDAIVLCCAARKRAACKQVLLHTCTGAALRRCASVGRSTRCTLLCDDEVPGDRASSHGDATKARIHAPSCGAHALFTVYNCVLY